MPCPCACACVRVPGLSASLFGSFSVRLHVSACVALSLPADVTFGLSSLLLCLPVFWGGEGYAGNQLLNCGNVHAPACFWSLWCPWRETSSRQMLLRWTLLLPVGYPVLKAANGHPPPIVHSLFVDVESFVPQILAQVDCHTGKTYP